MQTRPTRNLDNDRRIQEIPLGLGAKTGDAAP
jgi:hypothetical protein